MVLTTANFGGFSNFYRYYTQSQAGKSTGYRPTLKPLKLTLLFLSAELKMDDDDDQMNLEESVVTAGMSIDFEVAGEN